MRYNIKKVVTDLKSNTMRFDSLDIKDDKFEDDIIECYKTNMLMIQENIKKFNSNRYKKDYLRARALMGLSTVDKRYICTNDLVELHPVFYIFGLIIPHLTNIFESDLTNAFMMLTDKKQMDESSTLLLRTILMSEIKIEDGDGTLLTTEQTINVLTYLNIILHVIIHSLFKAGPDDNPKMISKDVINKFNLLMTLKLRTPPVIDRIDERDNYLVKVFRKISLLYGKKTVALKLTAIPPGANLCENGDSMPLVAIDGNVPSIEEYVDSFIIRFEQIGLKDVRGAKDDKDSLNTTVDNSSKVSIKNSLTNLKRMVNLEGKYYYAKFHSAFSYLPVILNRRDTTIKKDYVKVLMSKVSRCCVDDKVNSTPIIMSELVEKLEFNSRMYYPYIIGGTFVNDDIDDVDFILVNITTEIIKIIKNNDKLFYCDKDEPKKEAVTGAAANTFSEFINDAYSGKEDEGCCDISLLKGNTYKAYTNRNPTDTDTANCYKYLFTSNRTCNQPLILYGENCEGTRSTAAVEFEKLSSLLSKSASFILYLTSTDCEEGEFTDMVVKV